MDDDQRTQPAAVMARHSKTWHLCEACAELFEADRLAAGLSLVIAVRYCEHNGVHQAWVNMMIATQLCASLEEAERIDAGYQTMLDSLHASAAARSNPDPQQSKPN